MKDEIKAKWTKALRSGQYEQGQRYLNNNNKLCCLGVLCEIAFKEGFEIKRTFDSYRVGYGEEEHSRFLPYELSDSEDYKIGTRSCSRLMGMNDEGTSFEEIADYIDKMDLTKGQYL